MLTRADAGPPRAEDFDAAFAPWRARAILLAVSGGPDSMALAGAATQWRRRGSDPPLSAAIVDHGLRDGSRAEAEAAAAACAALGLPARVLRWRGAKPATAVQERARDARYALLAQAARDVGADVVMTAHHADDQVETILFRLLRGSGPAGLAGMAASATRDGVEIARPFLLFPRARLLAYAQARGLAFVRDPSNDDPRFARARLRALLPALAQEGATPVRFSTLARRLRRAEAALEAMAGAAAAALARAEGLDSASFFALPEDIRLRVLRGALAAAGAAAPRLDRLETLERRLCEAHAAGRPFRATLAGALIDMRGPCLEIAPAPPRRTSESAGP